MYIYIYIYFKYKKFKQSSNTYVSTHFCLFILSYRFIYVFMYIKDLTWEEKITMS